MEKVGVILGSGIGNVIQTVPFVEYLASEVKAEVYGVWQIDSGFPPYLAEEVKPFVQRLFDGFYDNKAQAEDAGIKVYTSPLNPPLIGTYDKWNIPESEVWFRLHFSDKEWKSWLSNHELKLPCKPEQRSHELVIWAGSKWASKMWPYYPILANTFKTVAVVGGKNDPGTYPEHVEDLRGQSLWNVSGIIKNATYYVGNEGGTSHLANAVNANTFIIWGGSNPTKNRPKSKPSTHHISLNLPCQPCQKTNPNRGWSPCDGCDTMHCLKSLVPQNIIAHLQQSEKKYL